MSVSIINRSIVPTSSLCSSLHVFISILFRSQNWFLGDMGWRQKFCRRHALLDRVLLDSGEPLVPAATRTCFISLDAAIGTRYVETGPIVSVGDPARAGEFDSEIFMGETDQAPASLEDGVRCKRDTHYNRNVPERFSLGEHAVTEQDGSYSCKVIPESYHSFVPW